MPRAPHSDPDGFGNPLNWREPVTPARFSRAALGSIAIHLVAITVFFLLPEVDHPYRAPFRFVNLRKATKLVAPRLELTQKDPNVGKVTQELDVRSATQSKPAPRSFQPPAPAGPANRPPSPTPALAPPDIEVQATAPEVAGLSGMPNLPRPNLDRPKVVLEAVSPAPSGLPPENPALRAPKVSLEDAARAARQPGGGGGGLSSNGDNGDPSTVGNMQLLSDPQNIDFTPYMRQVLNKVRTRWFAVIPQIARTGRQGIVVLQFSVDRGGQIPKVVIANTSGTPAFDQAAVVSVSASNPFPPLPTEYRGTEIRLQMAFSYNVPRAR
ncbi:MAG: TonB family protein [Acidobacteriota bacterium]